MGLMQMAVNYACNQLKGGLGELSIKYELSYLSDEYITINNINILFDTDYGSTQIDHVVVSLYGIFVIETKTYSGIITGTEYDKNWSVRTLSGIYSFYNPIRQNYSHIKRLSRLLNLPEDSFIPIVVFADSSSLNVKTSNNVITAQHLLQTIKQWNTIRFSSSDIHFIADLLNNINQTDFISKLHHIGFVHNARSADNIHGSTFYGICPICGNKLLLRHGKYGNFVGCGGYPNCKYTTNL